MLIVAGNVFVSPSELDAFMSDARGTLPLGRSADGNLFLSFTVEDPDEGRVVVLERWRDQQSLDAYSARPEVVAIFERWNARMRNEVRIYDVYERNSST